MPEWWTLSYCLQLRVFKWGGGVAKLQASEICLSKIKYQLVVDDYIISYFLSFINFKQDMLFLNFQFNILRLLYVSLEIKRLYIKHPLIHYIAKIHNEDDLLFPVVSLNLFHKVYCSQHLHNVQIHHIQQ